VIQNRIDKLKALTGIPAGQGLSRVDLMTSYLNTADQVKELHALARLASPDALTEA
jgi:hypothetical protein